jgi:formylglycine-generating enzyme required for sulfatase activity
VTVKAGKNEALISMRVVPSPNAPEPDAPPDDEVIAVTGVGLNKTAATIFVGGTGTLTAAVAPSNAANQNVTWTSSDTAVATVNNGVVNAAAEGTAVITVTTEDGGFTANCAVTVTPAPGTPSTHIISDVTVPFRYVPAGSFMLRQDGKGDPSPDLTMTISQGYWMGETEVTQELFQAVMGINPSNNTSNPEDSTTDGWKKLPVEQVTWYAAIAFCNKLSLANGKDPVYSVSGVSDWADLVYSDIQEDSDIPGDTPNSNWDAADMDITKNGYRLPTEMEWMWAAMGADTTNQPNTTGYAKGYAGSSEGSGQINVKDYAWNYSNSNSTTHEVGKKNANELGLKDMSGNVAELCWDMHDSYPSGEQTDYTGAEVGSGRNRVFRGGNYSNASMFGTVAYRLSTLSYDGDQEIIGFRVVCGQ